MASSSDDLYPPGRPLGSGTFSDIFTCLPRGSSTLLARKRFRGGRDKEGLPHHAFSDVCVTAELPSGALRTRGSVSSALAVPLGVFICRKGLLNCLQPLAGTDLEAVLAASARPSAQRVLPLAGVKHIARAVLEALHALHTAGFLHHDVKPSNVLLSVAHAGDDAAGSAGDGGRAADAGAGVAARAPASPAAAPGSSRGSAASLTPAHAVAESLAGLALPQAATPPQLTRDRPIATVTLTDFGVAMRRCGWRTVDAEVERSAAAAVVAELLPPPPPTPAAPTGEGGEEEPWDDDFSHMDVTRWQGAMRQQGGTLFYRPPEILFGALRHDAEVDAWAAGVMLLEMLRAAVHEDGEGVAPARGISASGGGASAGDAAAGLLHAGESRHGDLLAARHPGERGSPPAAPPAHGLFTVASQVSCLVAIVNMMGQPHPRLWPDAAFGNVGLPTFMEFLPTCGHCLESGEGSNGARALAHTQREALATLQSAAAAARDAGCEGLSHLLQRGLCCSQGEGSMAGGAGAGGEAHLHAVGSGSQALVHAHAVVGLAEWTGLLWHLRSGVDATPALQLFDVALRLTTLDPSRRMHLTAALRHAAFAEGEEGGEAAPAVLERAIRAARER